MLKLETLLLPLKTHRYSIHFSTPLRKSTLKIYRRYIIIFFSRKVLYSLIKITKQEYENEIASSGFKCRNPISHSGKNNKYYYIVETDYENYLRFIKNKNRLGDK